MSWFQDLAGKAENILNKIDKNAANVLNKVEPSSSASNPNDVRLEIQEDVATITDSPQTETHHNPTTSPNNVIPIIKRSASSTSMNENRHQTPEVIVERFVSSEQAYPLTNSNSTSRRSSLNSRADLISVVGDTHKETTFDTVFETTLHLGTPQISTELEDALTRLTHMQSRANAAEIEIDSVRSELNDVNDKYQKHIIDTDSNLLHLNHLMEETQHQLKLSKQETEQAKNELAQYRLRAQSTLQIKDKIIDQLQSSSESQSKTHDVSGTTNNLEVENLRIENNHLRDEMLSLNEQLASLRKYVDRLESSQKLQQYDFDLKIEEFNRNTLSEESTIQNYQTQIKVQQQEVVILREEIKRLNADHANQIHLK